MFGMDQPVVTFLASAAFGPTEQLRPRTMRLKEFPLLGG